MKVLGVVTARGGSKRLPNKNLALLGGKPLIAWSIEVGLATCHHVVTTTDSQEIADAAAKAGSAVVMRPKELARDDTPSEPVVRHAASLAHGGPYNAVLLLQPTSPFRVADDVRAAIRIMDSMRADSVISVVEFGTAGYLFMLGHAGRLRDMTVEGDTYTPNGAIYLIKWECLFAGESWYGPHAYGYVMPKDRSIDIDTHADFEAAKAMLEK
jgi:CMP-N-acetylneuraminic acid synthetase